MPYEYETVYGKEERKRCAEMQIQMIGGCFFPKSAELKHNRSIEYFVKVWSERKDV